MDRSLIRVSLAIALCSVCCLGFAQKDKDKDKFKVPKPEPKYHFAYRHILPDGSENSTMNWEGSINWDNHPKQDELWVQKDGKNYLISDKSLLAEFEKDYKPVWDFNSQRGKYMDGYYEARGNQRGLQHSARNIDRQISSLQRRSDRAKTEDEKADVAREIADLQKEKASMSAQQSEADKKLDQESKKREEFYRRREEIRAQVYKKTDKLIDDAFAKGLAKEATPG